MALLLVKILSHIVGAACVVEIFLTFKLFENCIVNGFVNLMTGWRFVWFERKETAVSQQL